MAYKSNYLKNHVWIKKTTQHFIKMSKGAKIWIGLQSYRSDSNIDKLPYKELYNDAVSAKNGGAPGVILFRMRLSEKINFKNLWS